MTSTCICVDQLNAELNEGKKTYSVTYIPQVMGAHQVGFVLTEHVIIIESGQKKPTFCVSWGKYLFKKTKPKGYCSSQQMFN